MRAALFDFDGTLSLIREGWQEVMVSFMVEVLLQLSTGETTDQLRAHVVDFVTRLTGKQTIYQMIQLAQEVKERGGRPLDPVRYKHAYHDRLRRRIGERIESLRSGTCGPQEWLVPGAHGILNSLHHRGVAMFLASGTDEVFVKEEARLLELTPFFGDGERIFGALDRYQDFSKRKLISYILSSHDLHGPEFVAFGDGYVEIENTKEVGGIAVGVATDEARRAGVDEWKRSRLIQAGADLIVPDFRAHEELVAYLFGEEE
jgi:phosphoglycolate phosphatase-like HAD superfamily hydrolase